MSISTADLCDQFIRDIDVCEVYLNSYGGKKFFSGPIKTVKISENNNKAFMEVIESAEPGSVIVLDGVKRLPCAWMGDRKAGIAEKRGIAGIIINGFVRDIEGISKLDIGVLALGSHPCPSRHKANTEAIGEKDADLYFGGVNWKPGQFVYADHDGVIVSPRDFNKE